MLSKAQREALQALADVMEKYHISFEADSNSDQITSAQISINGFFVYDGEWSIDYFDITKLLQEQE